jgi:hypothetical protein
MGLSMFIGEEISRDNNAEAAAAWNRSSRPHRFSCFSVSKKKPVVLFLKQGK